MTVAVLSGKGGAGKTTFSVNWARLLGDAWLLDCDVEEPNCHLFLQPENQFTRTVTRSVPVLDAQACIGCGACASFCAFNALLISGGNVVVMEDLCHSCGGCEIVCPAHAISYREHPMGSITGGSADNLQLLYGTLAIGEHSGVHIINTMRKESAESGLVIIDAPPGTSCSTVAAIKGADYCVVVTEPTPFGLSDLRMVEEMLREMGMPYGVVINRADLGNTEVEEHCNNQNTAILGRIPFDWEIAGVNGRGGIFVDELHRHRENMQKISEAVFLTILEENRHGTT
ncbi:ATP-binding protein [Salinispira pacifica]|uniref:Cobyrinic acid ac-diamide synthase n=1 Tax=Salinispira pacifica TaxID=1307761 RepID=V5WJ54_9SPIO|nr:ATP-binding protein [Salinispira pacifica]AHC15660.1 cobyrinic acid ac-diamide synthase [Salinispira pacifica]